MRRSSWPPPPTLRDWAPPPTIGLWEAARLGYVAARIAEELGGLEAYLQERRRQSDWLVAHLALTDLTRQASVPLSASSYGRGLATRPRPDERRNGMKLFPKRWLLAAATAAIVAAAAAMVSVAVAGRQSVRGGAGARA